MAKREVVANMEVDAPRAKRRKDAHAETPTNDDDDVDMADAGGSSDHEEEEGAEEGAEVEFGVEEVAEKGLQVWHAVKNAVNKECVSFLVSGHFLPPFLSS